ncbi:MAG: hypothetical protein AB9866_00860 [Syntrophobacteraceae bacterium]
MEYNIQDLSKEDFNRLGGVLLNVCRDYEPWADMMMLSGAGDPDVHNFPFDLDEIESIGIAVVDREDSNAGLLG